MLAAAGRSSLIHSSQLPPLSSGQAPPVPESLSPTPRPLTAGTAESPPGRGLAQPPPAGPPPAGPPPALHPAGPPVGGLSLRQTSVPCRAAGSPPVEVSPWPASAPWPPVHVGPLSLLGPLVQVGPWPPPSPWPPVQVGPPPCPPAWGFRGPLLPGHPPPPYGPLPVEPPHGPPRHGPPPHVPRPDRMTSRNIIHIITTKSNNPNPPPP
jgi:hypothetical protein